MRGNFEYETINSAVYIKEGMQRSLQIYQITEDIWRASFDNITLDPVTTDGSCREHYRRFISIKNWYIMENCVVFSLGRLPVLMFWGPIHKRYFKFYLTIIVTFL